MATYSTDRRSLLKILGGVGATCAYGFASDDLYGQNVEQHQPKPGDQHHHTPPEQPSEPRFFGKQDFEAISRLADLIIPPTDTPGAIGAGVPAFIDLMIARNTDQQLVTADGLRWLGGESKRLANKKFVELSEEQQLSIVQPLSDAFDADPNNRARNVQFFSLIKSLTVDGYYTSRVGLVDELKYAGDKVLSSFPQCTK